MTFEYIDTKKAIKAKGLRMTVVSGVPSPWGEAAKGIFHVKNIPWKAVRLDVFGKDQREWTGANSAPAAVYNKEPALTNWQDILELAERLEPTPALIPEDKEAGDLAIEIAYSLCGKHGLGWTRRIGAIHSGLEGKGGFARPVAQYLAAKYGYTPEFGDAASDVMANTLTNLCDRLKAQADAGSGYFVGEALTCADIYSAAFCALFSPLPEEQCEMHAGTRKAFEGLDAKIAAAIDPIWLEHRDRIYDTYLELPLSL